MAQWIEIPAQRVHEVSRQELADSWEIRTAEGCEELFVRHNGRVFRRADIQSVTQHLRDVFWLVEV